MTIGATGPVGVTGMMGPSTLWEPPELTDMEKAVQCINAMEPKAFPTNTRHMLASMAISLCRIADHQHNAYKQNEELREHITKLYEHGLQMNSHRKMVWGMLAFWVIVNIVQLVLKLMRYT